MENPFDDSVRYQPIDAESESNSSDLFRAFQANLLSLISHELRTPLTSILNALVFLEEEVHENPAFSSEEMIALARRNAQKLNQTLTNLLDLAAIEGAMFHILLREVDPIRLIQSRVNAMALILKDSGLTVEGPTHVQIESKTLLADPQKFGRAIDVCLEVISIWGDSSQPVQVAFDQNILSFSFLVQEKWMKDWQEIWLQGQAGQHAGLASSVSAFFGTVQSESLFLSRTREGLGSEFLLIHEIMKLHQGRFFQAKKGDLVSLHLELPVMKPQEILIEVLRSRLRGILNGVGSLTLCLIKPVPEKSLSEFVLELKKSLYRVTDLVILLPEEQKVALIMDDCKVSDIERIMDRIQASLGESFQWKFAHAPQDALEVDGLLQKVRST